MEKALNDSNIKFKITEAYVSVKMQEMRFNSRIKKYEKENLKHEEAKLETAKELLLPRYSEHHTALALDFSGNEDLYIWLSENAYKYGFILRYPKDKENITKYAYNKKHYRYVGEEVAKEMKVKNLCLEEYLSEEEK